jgi:hypothetical protein
MAALIPVNSDGNREILVDTGGGLYRFRTYFSIGQMDGWYLDIRDSVGNPLLLGKRLVPGCPNILKGQGDTFRDVQMSVVVLTGMETKPEYLGNGVYLYWMNPGDANPFQLGDVMIDIPADIWGFGDNRVPTYYLKKDGDGILASDNPYGFENDTFFKDNTTLRDNIPWGSENEFVRVDYNGNVILKDD